MIFLIVVNAFVLEKPSLIEKNIYAPSFLSLVFGEDFLKKNLCFINNENNEEAFLNSLTSRVALFVIIDMNLSTNIERYRFSECCLYKYFV